MQPIKFPRDHGAHRNIIEWWYFNGQLWDKAGKHYSFMDCLFRADAKKINIPFLKRVPSPYVYFAHSVLSDIAAQKNYKEVQNISMVSRDSFRRPRLFINYIDPLIMRGYANSEIAEISPFHFHLKTEQIDLWLESKKKPLLEGGEGHISVCGRESYYYSLTDLSVYGVININDDWLEVKGQAWMDHQWADVAYARDQWHWFALQLANGTEIMCVEYSDGRKKDYLADIIYADGRQEHFKHCVLTPGKQVWQSKKTKAKYPQSWTIEIPEKNMRFDARSLMPDQEIIFGEINYWEGPLAVRGKIAGKNTKGFGFVELVGYPSDYSYLLLAGKAINNKMQSRLKESCKKIFQKIGWQ